MNVLVYKNPEPYDDSATGRGKSSFREDLLAPPGGQIETSQVLFKRLANRGNIVDSSRCSLLTDKKRGGSART